MLLLATPSNRPHQVREMMASLRHHAHGRDWQVVIGCDPWDDETMEAASSHGCLIQVLSSSMYYIPGYDGQHPFNVTGSTNELCRGRTWDRVWTVNDDMRVISYGWDLAMADTPEGHMGIVHSIPASPCPCDFPCLTRSHLAGSGEIWPDCFAGWGADSWLAEAYNRYGLTWDTGVCVIHGQCDRERMYGMMEAMARTGHVPPDMYEYMGRIADAACIDWPRNEEEESCDAAIHNVLVPGSDPRLSRGV
jgi:hypothetical protein